MKQHDVIIAGVHMDLTEALKNMVREKVERLFRHEERIIRLRVELECRGQKGGQEEFVAKGRIEINGPDLIVSAATHDLYKSIDEMTNKLDRKIRRRARLYRVKRKHTHAVEIPASIPKTSIQSI